MNIYYLFLITALAISVYADPPAHAKAHGRRRNQAKIDGCLESSKKNPRHKQRHTDEELEHVCEKFASWTDEAAEAYEGGAEPKPPLTENQMTYWKEVRDCRGWKCHKKRGGKGGKDEKGHGGGGGDKEHGHGGGGHGGGGHGGGGHGGGGGGGKGKGKRQVEDTRAVRKEYRVLTDAERTAYHKAVKTMKTTMIDGKSLFDIMVSIHSPSYSPGAHFGTAFLPFHREYLKQYEAALRSIDDTVGLPYWDSSLDQGLPTPLDSIMWTPEFMGGNSGKVTVGPFANWEAPLDTGCKEAGNFLCRQLTNAKATSLFYQPTDVQWPSTRKFFQQFSYCNDSTFENEHGGVHGAVAGHMDGIPIAPADPLFWMHHNFIDYMWEQFRQNNQTREQREKEYPYETKCTNARFHYPNNTMLPFSIKNGEGLNNTYTDEIYRFDPTPVCAPNGIGCVPASPYLFCNTQAKRCLAKVKPGGSCGKLTDQDICYQSKCTNGKCQATTG